MKSSRITRVLTTTGFALGAFALAVAAQGVWTPAPSSPPNGNVDAPINVGLSEQIKLGPIRVNTSLPVAAPVGLIVGGKIQMLNGPLGAGRVLTDVLGNGVGTWEAPTGGGSNSHVLLDAPTILSNPGGEAGFYVYPTGPVVVNIPAVISGTIQAGVTTGVPANAKGVLLYGMWDCNYCLTKYIRFKHPGQTNWKRLVFINDAAYGSDNSAWIPLNSTGALQWEISESANDATGVRLEIQGYEI